MKGKHWVVTAALLVAGVRMWQQVRGKAKTPFAEWVVGWGAAFFFLALLSDAYPEAAAPLAGMIVLSDFLANGKSLFEDLSSLTQHAETSPLVPEPFAPGSQSSTTAPARGSLQPGTKQP